MNSTGGAGGGHSGDLQATQAEALALLKRYRKTKRTCLSLVDACIGESSEVTASEFLEGVGGPDKNFGIRGCTDEMEMTADELRVLKEA